MKTHPNAPQQLEPRFQPESAQQLEHELRANIDHDASAALATSSGWRESPELSRRVMYAELSHKIVGAAIEVHKQLGPGKLESAYQGALGIELGLRGIASQAQVPVALAYKGHEVGTFFLDFVVEELVVVELKAVDRHHAVHRAQVLSYLHATKLRLGLLINFNADVLWRSVQRVVL